MPDTNFVLTLDEDLPKITDRTLGVLSNLEDVLGDLRKTTPQLPRITRNVAEATDALPLRPAPRRRGRSANLRRSRRSGHDDHRRVGRLLGYLGQNFRLD